MGNKIITIIVPSYNMENYLPSCLGSLVVSPDWLDRVEVLVVNDGSTDRTSEIAHEFASRYPQTFVVIDKTNGHYGSCINAALKVATGTFVKVLDADDSFDTAAFAELLKALDQSESADERVDLFLTNFSWVDETGRIFRQTVQNLPADRVLEGNDFAKVRMQYMHAITYRTEMLRALGYSQTEGICYTDNEWACYPMRSVKRVRYVPTFVYRYLCGREGQSVDPKVVCKNWGMKAKVARRMVQESSRPEWQEETPQAKYVRVFTRRLIAQLYAEAILDFPSKEQDAALKAFDVELAHGNSTLRATLYRKNLLSKQLRFAYADEWFKKGTSRTVKLWLFRLYLKFAHCVRG